MLQQIWQQFLAAKFGCNQFRITPGIVSQLLRAASLCLQQVLANFIEIIEIMILMFNGVGGTRKIHICTIWPESEKLKSYNVFNTTHNAWIVLGGLDMIIL